MTFKSLNDIDLVSKIKLLVGEEKKITQEILEYLSEIERRRVYALRGYPSLFEFCVKELGYSESSAQRRIASMRLIKTLPEAKASLESGSVNLSTLSQLQSFIRKEETFKKVKLDHNTKLELLKTIENMSQRECERAFIKISPEIVQITKESIRPVLEELSEVKFMASKEFVVKLEELRNLLAHQNRTNSTSELFAIIVDMTLRQLNKKKESGVVPKSPTAAAVKHQIFTRDNYECQYVDPITKRKCQSKFKLQIDHVIPKALWPKLRPGVNDPENLRVLCQTHNQLAAIQKLSQRHMERFLSLS